jgi:predicted nucleic acid-binding protein
VILVDTSVWINHLREGDQTLAGLLEQDVVLAHPWVIGELALGTLTNREEILRLLRGLPQADVAGDGELLELIERRRLYGAGVGYVDAQLLAATKLRPETSLWTADQRLATLAESLGVGFQPHPQANR